MKNLNERALFALMGGALIAAMTSPSTLHAQALKEGTHTLSVGHGAVTFMSTLNRAFEPYADLTYKGLGPAYIKYEYAVADNIGLGLSFAYAENDWTYRYDSFDMDGNPQNYSESTTRNTYSILARFNFHMGNSEKFDPYIGFGVGYRDANWDIRSDSPYGNSGVTFKSLMPFGFELTVGARYFFLENLGVYAEMGGAKSVFQGGLAARF
jgi:opacity protein-like surface antigen